MKPSHKQLSLKLNRKTLRKAKLDAARKYNEAKAAYNQEVREHEQRTPQQSMFRNYPFLDLLG